MRYFPAQSVVSFFKEVQYVAPSLGALVDCISWEPQFSDEGVLLRNVAWMVKPPCNCPYKYGQQSHPSSEMPQLIIDLGEHLARLCGYSDSPDGVNCNLYAGPSSSLGWHSDNEPIHTADDGTSRIISVSFGASRMFQFRKKHAKVKPQHVMLHEFDVLTMERKTQLFYEHRVPQVENTFASLDTRLNLTFRYIQKHSRRCSALVS